MECPKTAIENSDADLGVGNALHGIFWPSAGSLTGKMGAEFALQNLVLSLFRLSPGALRR